VSARVDGVGGGDSFVYPGSGAHDELAEPVVAGLRRSGRPRSGRRSSSIERTLTAPSALLFHVDRDEVTAELRALGVDPAADGSRMGDCAPAPRHA